MDRRAAILAILAFPLARFNAFAATTRAQGKAFLTLDLDKWSGIEVSLGPDKQFVSAADIMAAIKEN